MERGGGDSIFTFVYPFLIFLPFPAFYSRLLFVPATEMEHPFGADMNDLPVAESILRLEQGTRVLMSQQEGENLQAYATRPFFNAG